MYVDQRDATSSSSILASPQRERHLSGRPPHGPDRYSHRVVSRRISDPPVNSPDDGSVPGTSPVGKGRPTPKRREAERRRSAPTAPPPTTRKEAAQRAKERATADRAADRAAGRDRPRASEERLLPRDAGPVRRRVRDLVDSRRSVGVLLLPLLLVIVIAQLSRIPRVLELAILLWYGVILALLFDLTWTAVRLRNRLREDFPEERPLRHVLYGLLRSTVLRRLRAPKPQVAVGAKV